MISSALLPDGFTYTVKSHVVHNLLFLITSESCDIQDKCEWKPVDLMIQVSCNTIVSDMKANEKGMSVMCGFLYMTPVLWSDWPSAPCVKETLAMKCLDQVSLTCRLYCENVIHVIVLTIEVYMTEGECTRVMSCI